MQVITLHYQIDVRATNVCVGFRGIRNRSRNVGWVCVFFVCRCFYLFSLGRVFRRLQKNLLTVAIYGRPKAFVIRDEISKYLESSNIEIDGVVEAFHVRFAFSDHLSFPDY